MRKVWWLSVLLTMASMAHAGASKPADPPVVPASEVDAASEDERLGEIYLRNDNLSAATAAFNRALRSNAFARLPEEKRYRVLAASGLLAQESNEHEAALHLLRQATEFKQADSSIWHQRLAEAFDQKDYADSAYCVATIARRWPETLSDINDRAIYQIANRLDTTESQPMKRQMLESLHDAEWTDSDGVPSPLWRDLARLLIAQGQVEKASAVAAQIDSARVALSMRIDKRFDRITRSNPKAYDIDRIASAEVVAARERVKAEPNLLRRVTRLQGLLLGTQQYGEVIAIADDVMAKVRDVQGKSVYKDFDDEYVWVLDQRARALARQGHWDDAIDQWSHAARRPEQGVMNVSQIINLGALYAGLHQPKEAMSMVSELGPMSPFGRMQLEIVKLEVALQQDDKAAVGTHLAYMREHRDDAIATWQSALLVTGDLDGAADLLVERLNHEEWRSAALNDMQQYADTLLTPVDAECLQRWRTIIARPAVQAALAKVGRIEHFSLDPEQT